MLALNLEAPLKLKFHVPPWLVMKDVRCNVRGHGGPPSGVWGDHPLLGYAGWLTLLADLAGFMNHRTILILLCPQQRMNAMWLPPLTQERKKWRARIMGGYPCPHVDTETDRWCYPCWLGTGEVSKICNPLCNGPILFSWWSEAQKQESDWSSKDRIVVRDFLNYNYNYCCFYAISYSLIVNLESCYSDLSITDLLSTYLLPARL